MCRSCACVVTWSSLVMWYYMRASVSLLVLFLGAVPGVSPSKLPRQPKINPSTPTSPPIAIDMATISAPGRSNSNNSFLYLTAAVPPCTAVVRVALVLFFILLNHVDPYILHVAASEPVHRHRRSFSSYTPEYYMVCIMGSISRYHPPL